MGLGWSPAIHAAGPAAPYPTDNLLWRQVNGPLLAVTKAGSRLVAVGDRGVILLSDDSGQNWRQAPSGTSEVLTSVNFPGTEEGWAVGQDSVILHTTDGGATWEQQHLDAGSDNSFFAITSVAPGHMVATGAYALAWELMPGQPWAAITLPQMDDDYHLNCAMQRGDDLLIVGEGGHGFIRSQGTWTALNVPYDGSQFGCVVGADGTAYSFGLRGSLFSQTAGGTWTRIDTGGLQNALFGGTLLSDGRLAVVGSAGYVGLFDPKTAQLTPMPPLGDATLSGVVEITPGKLEIVGDDGVHQLDTPPVILPAAAPAVAPMIPPGVVPTLTPDSGSTP